MSDNKSSAKQDGIPLTDAEKRAKELRMGYLVAIANLADEGMNRAVAGVTTLRTHYGDGSPDSDAQDRVARELWENLTSGLFEPQDIEHLMPAFKKLVETKLKNSEFANPKFKPVAEFLRNGDASLISSIFLTSNITPDYKIKKFTLEAQRTHNIYNKGGFFDR